MVNSVSYMGRKDIPCDTPRIENRQSSGVPGLEVSATSGKVLHALVCVPVLLLVLVWVSVTHLSSCELSLRMEGQSSVQHGSSEGPGLLWCACDWVVLLALSACCVAVGQGCSGP